MPAEISAAMPPLPVVRSPEALDRHSSRLLVVDVQERLIPVIAGREVLLARCVQLARAAAVLQIPVIVTEQYPKGLGSTVAELASCVPPATEKLRFSAAEAAGLGPVVAGTDPRHQVVVAGIEAHVCVVQTVLDLLAAGYQVFVVADAVGSRQEAHVGLALQRMGNAGAVITVTESVLFEWCETAAAPEFKEISRLVKDG